MFSVMGRPAHAVAVACSIAPIGPIETVEVAEQEFGGNPARRILRRLTGARRAGHLAPSIHPALSARFGSPHVLRTALPKSMALVDATECGALTQVSDSARARIYDES